MRPLGKVALQVERLRKIQINIAMSMDNLSVEFGGPNKNSDWGYEAMSTALTHTPPRLSILAESEPPCLPITAFDLLESILSYLYSRPAVTVALDSLTDLLS